MCIFKKQICIYWPRLTFTMLDILYNILSYFFFIQLDDSSYNHVQ